MATAGWICAVSAGPSEIYLKKGPFHRPARPRVRAFAQPVQSLSFPSKASRSRPKPLAPVQSLSFPRFCVGTLHSAASGCFGSGTGETSAARGIVSFFDASSWARRIPSDRVGLRKVFCQNHFGRLLDRRTTLRKRPFWAFLVAVSRLLAECYELLDGFSGRNENNSRAFSDASCLKLTTYHHSTPS